MSILSEFRDFAVKGNVVDLAVGVIIGGAFGKITTSLVEDVVMPLVSAVMGGGLDFNNLYILLGNKPANVADNYAALKAAGVPMLAYGSFITVLINFIILAFIIFLMVKGFNKLRKPAEEPAPAGPSEEVLLLREISSKLGN